MGPSLSSENVPILPKPATTSNAKPEEIKSLIPTDAPPSYEKANAGISNELTPGSAPGQRRPTGPRPPRPLELPALLAIKGKRVILASASPRRRQLLAQIGITNLEIIPSNFAENLSHTLSAFEYVLETATQKAIAVYQAEVDNEEKGEPALVLAADTIVVGHYGEILEKPKSEADHIAMLKMLRDQGTHKVYTAVVAMAPLKSARDPGYVLEQVVKETTVKFDDSATDELLLAYVRTREGADKAGGYGIQGTGSILIERIEGTFDNVVGLPLKATLKLIEKVMEPEEESDNELSFDR